MPCSEDTGEQTEVGEILPLLQYLQHPDVHHVTNTSHVLDLRDDIVIRGDSLMLPTPLLCQHKCDQRLSEANHQPQLLRCRVVVSRIAAEHVTDRRPRLGPLNTLRLVEYVLWARIEQACLPL